MLPALSQSCAERISVVCVPPATVMARAAFPRVRATVGCRRHITAWTKKRPTGSRLTAASIQIFAVGSARKGVKAHESLLGRKEARRL